MGTFSYSYCDYCDHKTSVTFGPLLDIRTGKGIQYDNDNVNMISVPPRITYVPNVSNDLNSIPQRLR